jgi:hypothetical protein
LNLRSFPAFGTEGRVAERKAASEELQDSEEASLGSAISILLANQLMGVVVKSKGKPRVLHFCQACAILIADTIELMRVSPSLCGSCSSAPSFI